MNIMNTRQICLLSMHGLGDLLMFLPTIQSISRYFSDRSVTVFVRNKTSSELLDMAHLNENVKVEYPRRTTSWRFKQTFNPLAGLRRLNPGNFWVLNRLRSYHPNITLVMTKMNPHLTPLMCLYSRNQMSIGEAVGWGKFFYTHPVRTDFNRHRVYRNLELLKPLSIPMPSKPAIQLYPEPGLLNRPSLTGNWSDGQIRIAIAPCVTPAQPWRLWPPSHWAGLIDLLYDRMGAVCYLLGSGSKEDRDTTAAIEANLRQPASAVNLCGELTIQQTAAFISRIHLVCGIDCGLLHIAAAVGTRLVAFWAATQTQHYPFTENRKIINLDCKCRGKYPHSVRQSCRQQSECLTAFTDRQAFKEIQEMVTNVS